MAAAAALDPKHEFRFSLGAPTERNLNTAAGNLSLTVAASHFLHVASGGTLPAAPGVANRFLVPWPDVDIALLKTHTLDAAVQGAQCSLCIASLRAMHDAFQRAEVSGLKFADVGSCKGPANGLLSRDSAKGAAFDVSRQNFNPS